MDKNWAKIFVSDAITLGATCILVIGGFPCKGFSKARGKNTENLKNRDSILFYEATRILELIRQAAGGKIIVRHIIENVIMDEDHENTISDYLAGRPTKIPAGPVCAANRDRLFWLDFTISPVPGERLEKGTQRNALTLVEDSRKCDIWDEGWGPTPQFKGNLPTIQGWQAWKSEPPDPRGIHIRSAEAIRRWEHDR